MNGLDPARGVAFMPGATNRQQTGGNGHVRASLVRVGLPWPWGGAWFACRPLNPASRRPEFDRFAAFVDHARQCLASARERAPTMPSAIRLRPASAADLPFLLTLRRLTMTGHLQRVGAPTDDEAHHRRIFANFEDAMIVCEGASADANPIGLLKVTRAADEWHVHQIQIHPSRQGHGNGEAVLRDLLAEAAREHVPVSLSVLHGNPARRLYERLGFSVASETETSANLIWRGSAAMRDAACVKAPTDRR